MASAWGTTPFAVVVAPMFGSAYVLRDGELVQLPLLADGSIPDPTDADQGAAVDFDTGFSSDADKGVVCDIEATLRSVKAI